LNTFSRMIKIVIGSKLRGVGGVQWGIKRGGGQPNKVWPLKSLSCLNDMLR